MASETSQVEKERQQGFVDEELVGGDSDSEEYDDDMDAEQRIYQELLEEEAAKRRAAAVEALNNINTGQAFSTIRALKKNDTLQASKARLPAIDFAKLTGDIVSSAKLPPIAFPTGSAAPMDLSSLLPGPAFLPSPAFAATPSEAPTGEIPESVPATSGAADSQGFHEIPTMTVNAIDAMRTEAEAPATDQQAVHISSAVFANGESSHGGVVDLKSKLMATWHYSEVTGDGGVALSFGPIEGLDLEDADLTNLYEALGAVQEEHIAAEEEESSLLQGLAAVAEDDSENVPGISASGVETSAEGVGSSQLPDLQLNDLLMASGGLPTPTFVMHSSTLSAVPEGGSEDDADNTSDMETSQADLRPSAIAPSLPRSSADPPSLTVSASFSALPSYRPSSATRPSSVVPLEEVEPINPSVDLTPSPSVSPRLEFIKPPQDSAPHAVSTSAGGAEVSAPTAASMIKFHSPNTSMVSPPTGTVQPSAACMNTSLRTPMVPSSRPLSRETKEAIKADLSKSIRTELQKNLKPLLASNASSNGSAATAVRGSGHSPQELSSTPQPKNTTIRVSAITGKIKPINIVMLIVGTRGDVQPFIGIGLKLKEYGHRVRIASHKVYREFVTGFGLEFYPIGGDPKVLSEFVVKHRGIMPGLNISDAMQQREQVRDILYSSWGACVLPDPENPNKPFIADAIVANPPAYGHTHCAEKLNVPLHIIFTMPWTPTKAFPSPFARIKTTIGGQNSKAREIMNWLSYFAVEDLAWLGMSGMMKDFRKRILQLHDWSKEAGSHAIYHSKVPITYIWSPTLVERPTDWPHYCEVVGFINVQLQKLTKYTPPKELQEFLEAGPPPVYIGFGSLVMNDPAKLTADFLKAIKITGLRAIVQKGWGGLGAGVSASPIPDVLFIEQAPHDWLFERCCAVVHHGGAGTTACGLYCGRPTFIVPFFGDQPFWGAACYKAGVGPAPVTIDDLTTDRIVEALKVLILPASLSKAREVQARMKQENGVEATVDHLHRTIYGALLAGKTFSWMKQGASRNEVFISSEVEETTLGHEEESGSFASRIVGSVSRFFRPQAATKRTSSNALAASSAGYPLDNSHSGTHPPAASAAVGGSNAAPATTLANGHVVRPSGASFFVSPTNGAVISSPFASAAHSAHQLETVVARDISETGSSQRSVVEVVGGEKKRGGLLAWLGC
ncbi:hypothetical protein CEUSTIGMA_g4392.t1 [Chlamydomonas eustigma]|uniref:Uncharacterized protein n=1 Tax=Chlamydomonas eustigma TaxID=1157962 RepID=A0A250X1L2_9CHLO|nr:hypothetical protein CEUSTIGMA_g4392.t1 [Chlamydomonas eustigma]|eukprot:GAX76945.1 hypothetical protein CEUSTIGMA_g4392.t1 [Chlamydomonas eustigma]